ncbi:MAG: DNA polymerase IV [Dehalococcoidia bacterium]|nr:DNA polymerase IV [Dehalococcoidia bacterium]
MRTIFHADLDAFFVSVERALDPSLAGVPVVVGGEPGGRGVVSCASYEARRYGLHAGMPLAHAYRLCPHARFLPGHFDRYQEVSRHFLAILGEYTPLLQSMGLDEAYLDMTGFESLYGPPQGVALVMKRRIREELHITASIGIATSKVVAKVASDACKPDGLLQLEPGQEAAFLAPRPARELPGVGEKTAPLLAKLGITTIGGIARTPPSTLRCVLGARGDVLWRSAQGLDDSPVPDSSRDSSPKSISRETTFGEDTLDLSRLQGTLRYLAERVCAELRSQHLLARSVTLRLRWDDFTTLSRQRTPPRPLSSDEAVYATAHALLERELAIEAAGKRRKVRLIGVGVAELRQEGGQLSLLDREEDDRLALAQALDSIHSKYGYTAVQKGLTHRLREAFPEERGRYLLKASARTPFLRQPGNPKLVRWETRNLAGEAKHRVAAAQPGRQARRPGALPSRG